MRFLGRCAIAPVAREGTFPHLMTGSVVPRNREPSKPSLQQSRRACKNFIVHSRARSRARAFAALTATPVGQTDNLLFVLESRQYNRHQNCNPSVTNGSPLHIIPRGKGLQLQMLQGASSKYRRARLKGTLHVDATPTILAHRECRSIPSSLRDEFEVSSRFIFSP